MGGRLVGMCLIGVLAMSITACRPQAELPPRPSRPTGDLDGREIHADAGKAFLIMPDERRTYIMQQINKLSPGESRDSVLKKLGKPTREIELLGKEGDAVSSGTIISYYFIKADQSLVNEIKDEYVDLIFDTNHKLIDICIKGNGFNNYKSIWKRSPF